MGNLIFHDEHSNVVYETTKTGVIISSFCAPGTNPKMISDGTNLWESENPNKSKTILISIIELSNNLLTTINSIIAHVKIIIS